MRKNRALVWCIIVIILVMMLGNLGFGIVAADEPGGPFVIAGRVYDEDGKYPGDGYEGAYASVFIEHDGAITEYEDPNGLELADGEYWYVVTIPEGAWDLDDRFWVWVDGSDWGDPDFTCRGHDDTDKNSWTISQLGSDGQLDVNTGDTNLKPLIAWIFAIILAVIGIIVGIFRPLKIPFSGRPQQPGDLVDEIIITGEAEMPAAVAAAPAEAAPAEAAPAEPAPTAEQERTCETCGGNLEFIPEYKTWYCYTCKKYPDEDEEPPPPEDETPPPGGA